MANQSYKILKLHLQIELLKWTTKLWLSYQTGKKKLLQDKLSLGLRDDNFETSVVFCNSVYYNQNQYLYKSYANNVLLRLKRKFPDQKIIKVHDFRKTHASLLFESGVSIKDVSNRLDHKSTKVTEDIYVKVTPTKKKEFAQKFAEYMAF